MIIKMLHKLRRRMDGHGVKFNRELENKKKSQEEVKNTITEIKEYIHTSKNHGEGNGTPLQYSCLENPMDKGAW